MHFLTILMFSNFYIFLQNYFKIYDKFFIFRNEYFKRVLIINIKIMKKFKCPDFHNLI